MGELDGILIRNSARGIAELDGRELCNVVFAMLVPSPDDEETRDRWIEDLYQSDDAEARAFKLAMEQAERLSHERAARDGGQPAG